MPRKGKKQSAAAAKSVDRKMKKAGTGQFEGAPHDEHTGGYHGREPGKARGVPPNLAARSSTTIIRPKKKGRKRA